MKKFLDAASAAGLKGKVGKQAIKREYRSQVKGKKAAKFTGSVDIDEHFRAAEPHANRWDYGVGVKVNNKELAFWIEPHSASSPSEVDVMIKKLKWLKGKLQKPEFRDLYVLTYADKAKDETKRKAFLWIHDGTIGIRPGSREEKQLADEGMGLPQRFIEIG